jgi:glycine/D-amino acid oxidase-like deaminating enzyme
MAMHTSVLVVGGGLNRLTTAVLLSQLGVHDLFGRNFVVLTGSDRCAPAAENLASEARLSKLR